MSAEASCDLLAGSQHGVISRTQALQAGMSKGSIDRRVRSGRWRIAYPGVYVLRSVPASWHQRLAAAVLRGGPSALASHRSAARLWEMEAIPPGHVDITVKSGRKIPGVVVRRRQPGDDPGVFVLDGIPCTNLERTLLDLAATSPPRWVGLALDEALRRGSTTIDKLHAMLWNHPGGRPGTRLLRKLLEDRDAREAKLESRLEAKLFRILKKNRAPLPTPQFLVMDGDMVVARLDFAYPDKRIGIEADGYRWHGQLERWKDDLRRENRLKLLGWTILRFSWEDVQTRPDVIVAQIRTALTQRFPGDRASEVN